MILNLMHFRDCRLRFEHVASVTTPSVRGSHSARTNRGHAHGSQTVAAHTPPHGPCTRHGRPHHVVHRVHKTILLRRRRRCAKTHIIRRRHPRTDTPPAAGRRARRPQYMMRAKHANTHDHLTLEQGKRKRKSPHHARGARHSRQTHAATA